MNKYISLEEQKKNIFSGAKCWCKHNNFYIETTFLPSRLDPFQETHQLPPHEKKNFQQKIKLLYPFSPLSFDIFSEDLFLYSLFCFVQFDDV